MKLMSAGVAMILAFAPFHAAQALELPDCKLEDKMEAREPQRYFMEVAGHLKSGLDVTYERDEPVLAVDLKVVRTRPVLIPSGDARLKNSWPLSPSFRFQKGIPIPISEVEASDGRRFGVVSFKDRSVLHVTQTGDFCNKTRTVKPDMQVWQAGTLSKEPDDVIFERTLRDEDAQSGSLRIVYVGTSAGALQFREVWVQDTRIGKSIERNFDQFAKSIEIAGFKFQVLEAKSDKVKLRYDIPNRIELSPSQRSEIALQNKR